METRFGLGRSKNLSLGDLVDNGLNDLIKVI